MPDRNYKEEYKKFQSSPSSIKKRVKLNKINRDKGTYGNNDGKDNSHVKKGDGTVIVVLKSESSNRGSKGDMPGDKRARGVSIMKTGGIPTDPPNDGKKKPSIRMSPKGDPKPKINLHKTNKIIAGKNVPIETNNLLKGLFEAQKDLGINSKLKQIPKNLDINSKDGMKFLHETFKGVNKELEFINQTQDQNKLNNLLKQTGVNQKPTGLQKLKGFMNKGFKVADKILRPLNPFIIPYDGQFLQQHQTPPVSARGSRVYQNKHVFTAKSDNEFKKSQQEKDWRKQRDKEIDKLSKNIDKRQIYGGTSYGTATYAGGGKVYKDNPDARKASSGGIYTRGFDYHGGGPYYGQSGGAAALGAGAFGAGAAGTGNDGTGSGGGGDDKRKDAKIKEKSGTTIDEKRALRKQKKALRKARRQHGQDSVAYRAQADDLADMQLAVQNDTFTALDNVKPWYKSKKGWSKDEYNRINSAQKQKKKWEKANPDKKWEELGGDDDKSIAAGSDRFSYYAGMTRTGHRVTKTGAGQAWGGGQSIERGQYSSWARMA